MIRYKFFQVISLILVMLCFVCGNTLAAGMRIVPSATQVTPGEDFYFDVVADAIPADGLGGVQFRLNMVPSSGTATGVTDLSQAGAQDIAVVTPLLASPATSGHSGIGDFFWNAKGPNGVLVMDNETLANGSALYTFAHTSGAIPPSGSGTVARFAVRVGSGVNAERLDIGLSDVMLLDGGPTYPLDYVNGSSVQLRCMTKVPSLLGLDRASALAALTTAKLTLGSVYEVDNTSGTRALNVVLEQSVLAGSALLCQAPVNLAINTPPLDVTNLAAIDKPRDGSGAVLLSWTPPTSSDTAGYKVYSNGTLLKQITGAAVNGTEIGGLNNGVVTRLKLTAYDTVGNESAGTYVDALPLYDEPQLVTASVSGGNGSITPGNATVTYGASATLTITPSTGFHLAALTDNGVNVLSNVTGTTYTISNVTAGHTVVAAFAATTLPALTITEVDSTVYKSSISLSGTIESGAGINISSSTSAVVGAVSFSGSGGWSCGVSNLVPGANVFTVTAMNSYGSTSVKSVTIMYTAGLAISVSPASISTDQTGSVQLLVHNFTAQTGEILVEQFVDANRNGVIDTGDYAIRSFKVKDGTTSSSPNIQGDEDGTLDSAITTTLKYDLASDLYHAPGSYIVKVTAGADSATASFTVKPGSQMQTVSGMVLNGATPVPGAIVRLLDKWKRHVSWAIADDSGTYVTVIKQPGDYVLLPVMYGYVGTATPVSLSAGQSIANLQLSITPGTYHVTGHVMDNVTGTGIPGVWVQADGNAAAGISITNDSGAYDLLLPAGQYSLNSHPGLTAPGSYSKGYTGYDNQPLNITINGDTSSNDIPLKIGDIYASGRILDPNGAPVAGIPVKAKIRNAIDKTEPVSYGISNASGNYSLSLFEAANWDITLDNSIAQTLGYIGNTRRDLSTSTGPLNNNDLTVHPITAWVQGKVKTSDDQSLSGVEVTLRNADSSIVVSTASAQDGTYRLGAFAGNWFVDALTENKGTHPVPEQGLVLTDTQTASLDFVVDVTPPTFTINPVVSPTTASSQTISGTVEAGSTVLVTANTSAVVGNVTYQTPTTWSCPVSGLANGNNTITVTATDALGNHAALSAVIVYNKPAGPDLIVTAVGAPAKTSSGQTITIPVTVKNQGTATSGLFYVGLYLSSDSNITTGDTFLGQEYLSSLVAGGEQTFTTTITIPKNITGTYYIGAIADTKSKIAESDESNNSFAASPTTITAGPDLIVTALGAPAKTSSGQTITVPVTAKNQGTGTSGLFYVGLYLSTDSNITTSDTFLGDDYISSLAAGSELTYTTTIAIPENITGTYYIGAIADTKNKIIESDKSNNSFAASPTVITPGPDLVVTALGAPASAAPGQAITVPVTVKNQGTGTSGLFYVGLYLSTDSGITTSDTFLGDEYISSLAAGAQLTYNTTITIPDNITGTYYIGAIADTKNKIIESDKSNNSFAASPTTIAR